MAYSNDYCTVCVGTFPSFYFARNVTERERLFPCTWTHLSRPILSASVRIGASSTQTGFPLGGACPAKRELPLPAVSSWTGRADPLAMTRPTDDGAALPRCLWHCADDDTREYPPGGSSFSRPSPVSRWGHSPRLPRGALSRGEPPRRTPKRTEGPRERETSPSRFTPRVSRDGTWTGWPIAEEEAQAAYYQAVPRPGLVASGLPRLPSKHLGPKRLTLVRSPSTMPPISGVLL